MSRGKDAILDLFALFWEFQIHPSPFAELSFCTRAFMPAVAESISRLTLDSATPPHGSAQNDEVGIFTLKNQNFFYDSKKLRSFEYRL